jgi:hypothetical protein
VADGEELVAVTDCEVRSLLARAGWRTRRLALWRATARERFAVPAAGWCVWDFGAVLAGVVGVTVRPSALVGPAVAA